MYRFFSTVSLLLLCQLQLRPQPQNKETRGYPPLSRYGIRAVVPGIDYPAWFSDPKLSLSDREYLVSRYNRREWLRFNDLLQKESEPKITSKDGTVFRLQPLLDMLVAVGGVTNPAASQVKSRNAQTRVQIKPRDGFEQDQPSADETTGNPQIDVIDAELRWYRQKKYAIPPTIGVAESAGSANRPNAVNEVNDGGDTDRLDILGFMMQGQAYFSNRPGAWERFVQRHPEYQDLTPAALDETQRADALKRAIEEATSERDWLMETCAKEPVSKQADCIKMAIQKYNSSVTIAQKQFGKR